MMRSKPATAMGALMATALWAPSASATVQLVDPSTFNGQEILFNDVNAIHTGSIIRGYTNQTHTAYLFEGTTVAANGTIGNQIEGVGGQGQAVITALGYTNNHYPRLTSLSYYREDGGLFNNTEFKLEDLVGPDMMVKIFAWDQNSLMHDLGFVTLGGDNRFAVWGTDGDSLSKIQWVAYDGAVGKVKQTRVEDQAAAVPEPTTWAMMIIGFGLVGAAMRKKPRQSVSLRYA